MEDKGEGVVMEYEHPLRRQPLRDPSYSLADRRREEEALRTAVEMMKPECRPACAFPLGDVPEVRLEYPHHHWLYVESVSPAALDALGRLCGMLGYHFRPVMCVILGERGAEMLRHSTGVDAKALGRLLTVVCVKEREQIWRMEEEK